MAQKQKRNHWVPQAYLRSFAADPLAREKIWILSKKAGSPSLKPIKKVAVRFYLYTPRHADGTRDYSFEKKLASLEQLFGLSGWQHIAAGDVDLCDPTMRKGIALLTAVMWLRNPKSLTLMRAMHAQFLEFYSQLPALPDEMTLNGKTYKIDKDSWPAYRDATDDDIRRMWTDHIESAVWLAELLMKMRWGFFCADQPVFITTDNPVVPIHPSLRFKGLKAPETMILFPLSPTRVLFMDNHHNEPDGQSCTSGDVPRLNSLLWREAIDHMFSSRHPDKVCREIADGAEAFGF